MAMTTYFCVIKLTINAIIYLYWFNIVQKIG